MEVVASEGELLPVRSHGFSLEGPCWALELQRPPWDLWTCEPMAGLQQILSQRHALVDLCLMRGVRFTARVGGSRSIIHVKVTWVRVLFDVHLQTLASRKMALS